MRNRLSSKKLFIGVTGGIGSGKSLACRYFEKLGCKIFYADDIARKLYFTNRSLKIDLVKNFGNVILDKRKNISFDSLRKIVFSNSKNQERVNKIVHPFVIAELLKRTKSANSKIILVEAALIFESGFDKYLDFTIEVFSTVKNRIERVKKRGKLTAEQIKSIIKLQMPEKEKLKRADFVIKNDSTESDLKNKVKFIFFILSRIV